MFFSDVLIIFVKYPQPGSVKTRLRKTIGARKATLLYKLFVKSILEATNSNTYRRMIFYTPAGKEKEIKDWLGEGREVYLQRGNNLGERLSNAFQFAFQNGARSVVAIGTESPLLDKKSILKAFKELKNKSCVIGPSQDGGYYLLGLSKFKREIFQNINWGTDRVFKQTLNAIKKSKLKFCLLELGFDVDTIDDLILLKQQLRNLRKAKSKLLSPLIDLLNKITF